MDITGAYITTGATDTFYVLRVSGYYNSPHGCYPRDRYVMNLGRNWENAIEKSQSYCKEYLPNITLKIPNITPKLEPLSKRVPKPKKVKGMDYSLPF